MKKGNPGKTQEKSTLMKVLSCWQLYVLMIPALVWLILFCYKPMYGVLIAFKDFKARDGIMASPWADPIWKYFDQFFSTSIAVTAIKNTIILSLEQLVINFPIPIIFALLLNQVKSNKARKFVQTVSYAPYFLSNVILVSVMNLLFGANGVVNALITGATGGSPVQFTSAAEYFRPMYIGSTVWQSMGFNAIVGDASRTVDINEMAMVQRWYEDTGVQFEWTVLNSDASAATEQISLMLTAGDDLPDVFWNFIGGQSSDFVVRYADQDVFLPTQDLIAEYCPTVQKVLDENAEYQLEVTYPDGNMYGFPYIEEMKGLVLTSGPLLINQDWLDQVNMEMPTTPDELAEVLQAFADAGDLNGNGVDDEIPMASKFGAHAGDTFGSYNMFNRLTGCFGQADSYCEGNPNADHLALIDGTVTFTAMDESIRKTADYFHELYTAGLLNSDCFENASGSTDYTNNELTQDIALIGVFGVWTDMTITNNEVRHQYVAIPQLTGEDGGLSGFPLNYSQLQDPSCTAITTECQYPEVIARFVEYYCSDPALAVQSNWGAVDYNYYEDEDGVLRFNLDENGDIIPVEPFANFGEMRSNTTTARGSMIVLDEYYDTVCEYTYDAVNLLAFQETNGKREQLARGEAIPKVILTQEDTQRLSQIQPIISDTVDRYIADWIQNGTSDESWNAYLGELESAGVSELVQIYQDALDSLDLTDYYASLQNTEIGHGDSSSAESSAAESSAASEAESSVASEAESSVASESAAE